MKFTFKCDICHREVKGGKKFEIEIYEKVGVCYADSVMIADASCNQCKQAFVRLAARLAKKARKVGAK
ncbi:hypothetical protein [Rheinheimera aquimaris]|uniref:hypothetical protein n=1 Tax=Rheinheimera aquimaris TaxID=412437 RepID=UPI001E3A1821|nr:hypothetical protein [Rheinheimera aquimaris]MCD1597888.1 hypothetical protein [Rheinheimera aquimaris]